MVAAEALSFGIARGEFLSFLGPSGCGKTTALRMLAGFEVPTTGEVLLDGQRVNDVPAHNRPVNMVFQHYALFPHLTVAQNIAYGLLQRRPRPDRSSVARKVDRALDMVRLTGFGPRRIWEMSGGQQQRVALARAIVNEPKILLLDEPLAALDRKLRREMQIELQTLQRQLGITFVLVTHDQEEALSMSDRICIMRGGRIVQSGSPSAGQSWRTGHGGWQGLCGVKELGHHRLCGEYRPHRRHHPDQLEGILGPDPDHLLWPHHGA